MRVLPKQLCMCVLSNAYCVYTPIGGYDLEQKQCSIISIVACIHNLQTIVIFFFNFKLLHKIQILKRMGFVKCYSKANNISFAKQYNITEYLNLDGVYVTKIPYSKLCSTHYVWIYFYIYVMGRNVVKCSYWFTFLL